MGQKIPQLFCTDPLKQIHRINNHICRTILQVRNQKRGRAKGGFLSWYHSSRGGSHTDDIMSDGRRLRGWKLGHTGPWKPRRSASSRKINPKEFWRSPSYLNCFKRYLLTWRQVSWPPRFWKWPGKEGPGRVLVPRPGRRSQSFQPTKLFTLHKSLHKNQTKCPSVVFCLVNHLILVILGPGGPPPSLLQPFLPSLCCQSCSPHLSSRTRRPPPDITRVKTHVRTRNKEDLLYSRQRKQTAVGSLKNESESLKKIHVICRIINRDGRTIVCFPVTMDQSVASCGSVAEGCFGLKVGPSGTSVGVF